MATAQFCDRMDKLLIPGTAWVRKIFAKALACNYETGFRVHLLRSRSASLDCIMEVYMTDVSQKSSLGDKLKFSFCLQHQPHCGTGYFWPKAYLPPLEHVRIRDHIQELSPLLDKSLVDNEECAVCTAWRLSLFIRLRYSLCGRPFDQMLSSEDRQHSQFPTVIENDSDTLKRPY